MIRIIDHEGNGYGAQAEITRKKGVNGEKSLTGIIYTNEEVLQGVDRGWKLEFENEMYAFTFALPKDTGNRIELDFDAVHEFFYDMSKSAQNNLLNDGSHTFRAYLDFIFRDTPYNYSLDVNVQAFEKQTFGQRNRLDLFYDVINTAGVEFSVNGSVVRIVERVGNDLSTIVKKGFNLNELRLEKNIGNFVTYQKGFGTWNDEEDHSKGRLEVEYLSPLAEIYGKLDADPIVDERYTVRSNLLARLQNNVEGSYQISVQIDMEDLTRAGYEYKQPHEGDSIMAINNKLGFQRKVRIVSYETDFDIEGNILDHRITCNSIGMVEQSISSANSVRYAINELQNDLELARQQITEARVSADGKSMNYFGPIEPTEDDYKLSIGDTWFDTSGENTVIKVWNGVEWRNAGLNSEDLQRQFEEMEQDIAEAQATADNAITEIEVAIDAAGFTSLSDSLTGIQSIATESMDLANDLSSQVSGFELTVDGFNQVVNDYEGQVAGFRSDVNGLNSTVASYEDEVATYATQVSIFENTVDGLQSTVTNVDGRINTLSNTVDGSLQRISDAEGNLTQIEQNINGIQQTVSDPVNGLVTQVSTLANGFNVLAREQPINLIPDDRNLTESWTGWNYDPNITFQRIINGRTEIYVSSVGKRIWYPLTLEEGKKYKITFNARTHVAGREIAVGRGSVNMDRIPLKTTAESYEVIFESDASSHLSIFFYNAGTYEIGNLRVVETTAVSKAQLSVLSDNINLRVSKGNVLSQINIEAGRTLIQSDKLYLDAQSVVFSGQAFIPGATIRELNADKINAGTLNGNQVRVINLDFNTAVGNRTEFVQSAWNSAAGGGVRVSGSGIVSTSDSGSTARIQNGVFLSTQPNGATVGYIGHAQTGNSPRFTIQTSLGAHFAVKQRYYNPSGQLADRNTLVMNANETLLDTDNFEIIGGTRRLGFGWRHYISGTSDTALMITAHSTLTLRARESSVFSISNNGSSNHASMFANLNMQGNTVTNQSDARLKTEITKHGKSSLDKIENFEFVDFRWLRNDKQDFGLIAQQIQLIDSSLVIEDEDGYLGLHNHRLNMMALHGLQELSLREQNTNKVASQALQLGEETNVLALNNKSEIDTLKETVEAQQNIIDSQQKIIEELERKVA